jgi:hypothetical protein
LRSVCLSVGVPQLSTEQRDGSNFSLQFSYNHSVMAANQTRSDDGAALEKVTCKQKHRQPVMSSRFAFSLTLAVRLHCFCGLRSEPVVSVRGLGIVFDKPNNGQLLKQEVSSL